MPRRVLIVDDHAINRRALKVVLHKDYDITEAANGVEALDAIRRAEEPFSAALINVAMPVMDGFDTLKAIRSNVSMSDLPVIMITGNDDEDIRIKSLSLGANDFITKPYNPDIIKHCLKNNIALHESAEKLNEIKFDKLTGLYSREAFFDKANALIAEHEPGYYLMSAFDLNSFKLINERFGTAEGDRVLKHLGECVKKDMASCGGIGCRITSDNFAALYPAILGKGNLATEILADETAPEILHDVTAFSIGRCVVADLSLSASSLYDRAYIAKQSVKGRYDVQIEYFNDSMLDKIVLNRQITSEMTQALSSGQFEAWFQPQYNHSTGASIGAEALVRWRHPQKGLISPDNFIPIFEHNGFIYDLDKYVWEEVCKRLRDWIDRGMNPLPVSVNISRYDIRHSDLIYIIDGLIKKYGLSPELLRLEITESAFSKQPEQIIALVEKLIKRGFTLEIDDFGSGYSSLNTLKDVPAQVVKLDMRFLETNSNSQRGGIILESIIRMSKALGMVVIAEGVETIEQADYLRSIGCCYIQGYLYARPMPHDEYEKLLSGAKKEERLMCFETDAHLNFLNDNIPGGLAIFECSNGSIRISYANNGFIKLFGYSRGDINPESNIDLMDKVFPDDRAVLSEQINAMLDSGKPLECVYRGLLKDGSGYKWINIKAVIMERRGDISVVYAVLLDVTSQQEIVEKLRISEEENKLAIQLSGNIIGRYNVRERFASLPAEVAAMHGMPVNVYNVPDGPIADSLIAPESANVYKAMYLDIISGKQSGEAVYRERFKNIWRWMEAKYITIFDINHMPVSAIISYTDVTERLEKEAVYRRWQQSLDEKAPESYTLYRCNLSKDASHDIVEGSLISVDFSNCSLDFDDRTRAYVEQKVFEDDKEKYSAFVKSDTMIASYYRNKRTNSIEYRENAEDGVRWIKLSIDLVEYPNSSDIEAYLMYEDINELKQSELQTKELAETDPLTGVLNRAAFSNKVEKLIRASGENALHAMLMLDIDGFKLVNDVFGHGAGDQALIDIANSLRSVTRRDDLVCRLGGDEFMVFLPNIPNDTVAANRAEKICSLMRRSFSVEVSISGSIGIVMIPRDGCSFETIYKKADSALYYVKGSGKNAFAFYRESMEDEHLPIEISKKNEKKPSYEMKRRMLIVDDNALDHRFLANMFKDEFIVDKAKDGASALIRLRHYGMAVSVVLLDLVMPGMDGFAVLANMQQTPELSAIPVIVVSGDDDRDTCLRAIRLGASDFVTKPVDPDILRLRVSSAISKAENERLRAKNSYLEMQNNEITRYRTVLEKAGIAIVEYDWVKNTFEYDKFISSRIAGTYDNRTLWSIFLLDLVADTTTVRKLQEYVHDIAVDRDCFDGFVDIKLKVPSGAKRLFRVNIYKLTNEFGLTDKLIMTFTCSEDLVLFS